MALLAIQFQGPVVASRPVENCRNTYSNLASHLRAMHFLSRYLATVCKYCLVETCPYNPLERSGTVRVTLQPPPCHQYNKCHHIKKVATYAIFFFSLGLMKYISGCAGHMGHNPDQKLKLVWCFCWLKIGCCGCCHPSYDATLLEFCYYIEKRICLFFKAWT